MNSFHKVYAALRRKNLRDYSLLFGCCFISVLLITAFSVIMQSHTVQTMLPEGGDSRKQTTMIFTMAVAGCAVFTCYASTLFFRSKSRETGIYMALGASKSVLVRLLARDLALVSLASAAAGIALGLPLAAGIWQLFRLLVANTSDMAFRACGRGLVWPLAFSVFSMLMLFFAGWRFIRRGNVMDVVYEQRKSEPIRDVKSWYGLAGLLLMAAGGGGAVLLPGVLASYGYTPPFWVNLLYAAAAVGLYILLAYVVVRGFGGKRSYYKHIISRSMMKFQGRQTVLNMCVVALLVMSAYFAAFYLPMQIVPALASFAQRPVDNAFHYRADETGIPAREEILHMARDEGAAIRDYSETPFVHLATDGYDREWTKDGRYGDEYHGFYEEEPFLSASAFKEITGMDAQAPDGQYVYITRAGYAPTPYDYYDEMTCFTNPDTMQTLPVKFSSVMRYDMLHGFVVLSDRDYAAITNGLGAQWREQWVQFNVGNAEDSYAFAVRLKKAIIDNSTEKSAMYDNYDRIQRMNAHARGQEYRGDTEPALQVRYDARDTFEFNQYWRYMPRFRVVEQRDFIVNRSVFLMLFVFMAVICMAAVIVITHTRCLAIAMANRRMYADLRRLGAKRDYLYRSVKGQASKVFFVPISIGTAGILGFYTLLMFLNDGALDAGELLALGTNAALTAASSLALWGIYRRTLRKVGRILDVGVVSEG